MPWCPECLTEYDMEGIDTCADCRVSLVNELPAALKPPHDFGEPVRLLTVDNDLDADMLLTLLTDAGIPAYKRGCDTGAYMSLYMGVNFLGVDICVPELLLEQAQGIVDACNMCNDDNDDITDGEGLLQSGGTDAEMPYKPLLRRRIGRILLWSFLIAMLGSVLWPFVAIFLGTWGKIIVTKALNNPLLLVLAIVIIIRSVYCKRRQS